MPLQKIEPRFKPVCRLLASGAASLLPLLSPPAHAWQTAAPHKISGHVDIVDKYYARGITTTYGNVLPGLGNRFADAPESDKPALQWGVDYSHDAGWYLGYWASQTNYSYRQVGESYDQYANGGVVTVTDWQDGKSIEHDLYGGYTGKAGDLSYTLGMTGYLYTNGRHANALETKLGLAYKGVSLNAQTLLNDVVWGNRGDTYWTAGYSHALSYDLTLSGVLGWYTYNKEGKFWGTQDPFTDAACTANAMFVVNGCYVGKRPVGDAFRHFTLGISQPLGSTGLVWSLQALIGGENRAGVSQKNRLTGAISYTF